MKRLVSILDLQVQSGMNVDISAEHCLYELTKANHQKHDSLISLKVSLSGIEAARSLLLLMAAPERLPPSVVNEETIDHVTQILRHHALKHVLPVLGASGSGVAVLEVSPKGSRKRRRTGTASIKSESDEVELDGGPIIADASCTTSPKEMQPPPLSSLPDKFRNRLGHVVQQISSTSTLLSKVLRGVELYGGMCARVLRLPDTTVLSALVWLLPSLSTSHTLAGDLQLSCIGILRTFYGRHPSLRSHIRSEIIHALQHIPTNRRSSTVQQYRLLGTGAVSASTSDDGCASSHPTSIMMVSALFMHIVHATGGPDPTQEAAGDGKDDTSKPKTPTRRRKRGKDAVLNENRKRDVRLCRSAVSQANDCARSLVDSLLGRCGSSPGVSSKNDAASTASYRRILEILVNDLLCVHGLPEWPAAEVLLRTIASALFAFTQRESSSASTPLRQLALVLLGNMAARMCPGSTGARVSVSELLQGEAHRLSEECVGGLIKEEDDVTKFRRLHASAKSLVLSPSTTPGSGCADTTSATMALPTASESRSSSLAGGAQKTEFQTSRHEQVEDPLLIYQLAHFQLLQQVKRICVDHQLPADFEPIGDGGVVGLTPADLDQVPLGHLSPTPALHDQDPSLRDVSVCRQLVLNYLTHLKEEGTSSSSSSSSSLPHDAARFYLAQWLVDTAEEYPSSSDTAPSPPARKRSRSNAKRRRGNDEEGTPTIATSSSALATTASDEADTNRSQRHLLQHHFVAHLRGQVPRASDLRHGTTDPSLSRRATASLVRLLSLRQLRASSSFVSMFRPVLGRIIRVLSQDPSAKVRSSALRALTTVIEADPLLLSTDEVHKSVCGRFYDQSISVRDKAVELVGKSLSSSPELADQYYSMIEDRILDTGVSVRKRVVRIMTDLCLDPRHAALVPRICLQLAGRLNDEESIRKGVLSLFKTLWFSDPPELDQRGLCSAIVANTTAAAAAAASTTIDATTESPPTLLSSPSIGDGPRSASLPISARVEQILAVVSKCSSKVEWFVQLLQELLQDQSDGSGSVNPAYTTPASVDASSGSSSFDSDTLRDSSPRARIYAVCRSIVAALAETLLCAEETNVNPSTPNGHHHHGHDHHHHRQQQQQQQQAPLDDTKNNNWQRSRVASCITALGLFAQCCPSLLVPHVLTIEPYLKPDEPDASSPAPSSPAALARQAMDGRILSAVADIMRLTVPLVQDPSGVFLAELRTDLVALIYKQGLVVVNSCVRCLCALVPVGGADHSRSVNELLIRFWDFARQYEKQLGALRASNTMPSSKRELMQKKRTELNTVRSLYTIGLLCRYHDFDAQYDHEADPSSSPIARRFYQLCCEGVSSTAEGETTSPKERNGTSASTENGTKSSKGRSRRSATSNAGGRKGKAQPQEEISSTPSITRGLFTLLTKYTNLVDEVALTARAWKALGCLFIRNPLYMMECSDKIRAALGADEPVVVRHQVVALLGDFLRMQDEHMQNHALGLTKRAGGGSATKSLPDCDTGRDDDVKMQNGGDDDDVTSGSTCKPRGIDSVGSGRVDANVGRSSGEVVSDAFAKAVDEGGINSIIQGNIELILALMVHAKVEVRMGALATVEQVVRQGLVHPMVCVPHLIAVSTDREPKVRDRARVLLSHLADKHFTFIRNRLSQGIRMSFDFQRTAYATAGTGMAEPVASFDVPSGDGDGESDVKRESVLAHLYRLFKGTKTNRTAFLQTVTRLLDVPIISQTNMSTEKNTQHDVALSKYISECVATLPFTYQDEPLYVVWHLNKHILASKACVLQTTLKSALDEEEHDFDDDNEDGDEEKENPPYAALCCRAASCVMAVLLLKRHLRNVYRLSQERVLKFTPSYHDASNVKAMPCVTDKSRMPHPRDLFVDGKKPVCFDVDFLRGKEHLKARVRHSKQFSKMMKADSNDYNPSNGRRTRESSTASVSSSLAPTAGGPGAGGAGVASRGASGGRGGAADPEWMPGCE